MLDQITEVDMHMVDQQLSSYIIDKFQEEVDKLEGKHMWQSDKYRNILRVIMRLKLAKIQHIAAALEVLDVFHG